GLSNTFSKHAQRKVAERELEQTIVEKVLESPDFVFYDLVSKTMIAIAKVEITGISTNLIIPYVKENDILKVVTIYPCRDIKREIKRKEGTRWVKIK
ncbi:unnamed protein product, partial [marine sediment metagenome]